MFRASFKRAALSDSREAESHIGFQPEPRPCIHSHDEQVRVGASRSRGPIGDETQHLWAGSHATKGRPVANYLIMNP